MDTKKVLHLLSGGGAGGIEILCEQIGLRGHYHHEFCFLFSAGVIAERMKANSLTTYDLSGESFWEKSGALKEIFLNGGYDAVVVHHEGVKLYLLYEMLVKLAEKEKILDVTFIKYLHCAFDDADFYTGKKIEDKLHHYLLGKTLNDSDSIVAVSEFAKNSYATEFGIDEDKIKVIYNGIDAGGNELIRGRQAIDCNRLLYIGRLVDVKGVDVLIRAVALLRDRGIEASLDVLGDGETKVPLVKLAETLGVSNQVSFRGVVLDKDEYFDKDGIFVYPSVWQEAFGISILEAMSHGLICVASRVGGIPEIITDDKQGILFEAGNAKALADAIVEAQRRCGIGVYEEYCNEVVDRAEEFGIDKSVAELERLI